MVSNKAKIARRNIKFNRKASLANKRKNVKAKPSTRSIPKTIRHKQKKSILKSVKQRPIVKKNKFLKRSSDHRKLKTLKNSFKKVFHIFSEGKPDTVLLGVFLFLVGAGLFMVLDTSLVFAKREFHNAYHFLILQSSAALVGLVLFYFAYTIDYRIIRKFISLLLGITILLLLMTLFTHEVNGAKSWISLGGFNLQPSEIAKLTFVLYISGIISQKKKWHTVSEYLKEDFLPFVLPLVVILGFVLLGKDLGTSIIITSVALFIYFFKSSTKYEYIAVIGMLIVFCLGAVGMIALEGYRGDRVKVYTTALTQSKIYDESGSGYQMKQILLALGTGGFSGVGLAESLQKYDLVETTAATDSVIAIIAEEFGFIGAVTTLSIFALFIYRGLKVTMTNKDPYGQIVAVGIVSWIGMQVFIHVASNVVVTPLTGVPMPFLSYGGSSLVCIMIASGILLNISRHREEKGRNYIS